MKNNPTTIGDPFEIHHVKQNITNLETILGNWWELSERSFGGLTLDQEIGFLEQERNRLQYEVDKKDPSICISGSKYLYIGNGHSVPYPPCTSFEKEEYSHYGMHIERAIKLKMDTIVEIQSQLDKLIVMSPEDYVPGSVDYDRIEFKLSIYQRRLDNLLAQSNK